jgi:3-methyladenine DNA glycosylase AlkD
MIRQHKKYLDEVVAGIQSVSRVIPAQRALHKFGFSFTKEPFETQLEIWNQIWANSGYQVQIHAFFFLERWLNRKELLGTVLQTSVMWQEDVDDWPLNDSLSKINTKALELHTDQVYPQLVQWNQSENLWKRRQSVVSLLYYSRTKKVFLPFQQIAVLVRPLLTDKEYYVQKGVGWTLREMYNVYPEDTYQFLTQHIIDISAIAFTIAIEKMDDERKNELKRHRKQNR